MCNRLNNIVTLYKIAGSDVALKYIGYNAGNYSKDDIIFIARFDTYRKIIMS